MRPYGENKKFRFNYPDCHPKRLGKLFGGGKWVNWWEIELGSIDKGRARQEAKRNIRKEIENGN